jgi:hypothetical protein
MSSIILIATCHNEKGLCNSLELSNIIEQIHPDVIFEEIPPGKFEAVYAGTRQDSLEIKAIKSYLHQYPATHHLPVDLDIDHETEKQIKRDLQGFYLICNDYNPEYNFLASHIPYWTEVYGFPFLNGDRCSELLLRKKSLEKQILDTLRKDNNQRTLDHEKLDQVFKNWIDEIENRENEMIRNIYNYMKPEKYQRALFLVGAEHRKSIMQKIQEYERKETFKLNWTFFQQ